MYGSQAGGTHPTGMLSYLLSNWTLKNMYFAVAVFCSVNHLHLLPAATKL